jgi:dipeptidyl-peptidase-4
MAQPDVERPYDEHLCRVRLDGTGFTQLTTAAGTHTIHLAPSFEFFLDVHASPQRPPRAELRRVDGKQVMTLAEANTERLEAVLRYQPPEEFQVLAADGQVVLWGSMYTPFDFDPGRAYPVILVVNTLASGFRNWFGVGKAGTFAQLGFITVELSLRGNIGRDGAFRTAFHGRTGCCEFEDAVSALEQLSRDRPWMDMSRVGLLGGSVSGFYAARFMLQAPDVFHVGVAERAPMSLGELWGGEAFLGMPSENPDGYAQASNAALADRLQGKLLIVSYLGDAGMRFASTVRMIEALTEAGRPYDLLVLPQGRRDTDYVWSLAIPRYFVEHLRPWDDVPVRRR